MDQYQVHNRDEACCGANREGDRKFPGDEVDRTIVVVQAAKEDIAGTFNPRPGVPTDLTTK